MQTLAVFSNPRKRKSHKHRSAAQRAATRKLVAMNRARRSGRAAPRRRTRARAAANPVIMVNPRRRRSRAVSRAVSRARKSVSRFRRRYSAAPSGLKGTLTAAAKGAAGAIAVDVAFGYINQYLPASVVAQINTNAYTAAAAKAGVAVALGHFGAKLPMIGPYARQMALGSLVVTLHDVAKLALAGTVPLGYYNAGFVPPAPGSQNLYGMGRRVSGVGSYLSGNDGAGFMPNDFVAMDRNSGRDDYKPMREREMGSYLSR